MKFQRIIFILLSIFGLEANAQETKRIYLSGTDRDNTKTWDFFCTKGQNSGKWTKIAVPSQWEQQGFGKYSYGTDNRNDSTKADEEGLYKYEFDLKESIKNQREFIVFEGSMTDTEVKLNGQTVGIHQGGFYRFKFEITDFVKTGSNLLEVKVSKLSKDESVNRAERQGDFWALGGIYRPVYIEVVPQSNLDRIAIDARANGSFLVDVFTSKTTQNQSITAQIQTLKGVNIGLPFKAKISENQEKTTLKSTIQNPNLWSAETPNLYQVKVTLKDKKGEIHSQTQRFGFRTVEIRLRDGIYVNGVKVIFKGVCRHSFNPETGRTLSKKISLKEVLLMKEMNMNAVRMSHYPPDQHFLDVCDSLGLFVLDELTGWQKKYDAPIGHKLVKELVIRDVNHPSILLWDNGNEGGWNTDLDNDYQLYDPQNRMVIHPWERFKGTDTKHYISYNSLTNSTLYGQEIYFPTEFMHGLYDGGHGAGLDDFWTLMLQHPYNAGGFLWSFHDEGIVRTDQNGRIDTFGNNAPDGILGPHYEKEASFYTIKEIWSPVYIARKTITPEFNGKLAIENRYMTTNLNQCTFSWKLVSFPNPTEKSTQFTINKQITLFKFSLAPNEKAFLNLNLPTDWAKSDALYLTATDPKGKEIFTWTWAIQAPAESVKKMVFTEKKNLIESKQEGNILNIKLDGISYQFDSTSGYLKKVITQKSSISLSEGPVLAGVKQNKKNFKSWQEGEKTMVETNYDGNGSYFKAKWIFESNQLPKLEYQYSQRGESDFMGISFNYPEEKITGMKWLGRGPYRVWKNRLKGQQFGVFHKDYNDAITGETWIYPEFKGYHSEINWVTVENKEANFTVYTENEGLFLQMLKPSKPKNTPQNNGVYPNFPDGNLSFLNGISPIGTKFQTADVMGPQSQKNMMTNYTPLKGGLWFDFR